MISLSIGDCKVDILPVVNGLESDTRRTASPSESRGYRP